MGENKAPNHDERIQPAKTKGDRVEVIKVLVIGIVSFVAGFALVILFLKPAGAPDARETPAADERDPLADGVEADDAPAGEDAAKGEDSPSQGGYAPSGSGEGLAVGANDESPRDEDPAPVQEGEAPVQEGEAPAEVPPGRTPDGVRLDGDTFYLKCWDAEGKETPGGACDRLSVIEKRFSTRLYVVDRCRRSSNGGEQGKLSIGMEVDFQEMSLSFWSGASSDIAGAAKIATCLRDELAGLPIASQEHKFAKYRLFFTVVFGEEEAKPEKPTGGKSQARKGKLVNVVMDRVNVRREPVTGDSIGKIGQGNQVKLLEKKGDWCRVETPNGNEGWMICESLDL